MNCVYCESEEVQKDGNNNGYQRYKCIHCGKRFNFGEYINPFIEHFGIKTKNEHLYITRDEYAIIDKKVHNKLPNFILEDYKQNPEKRQKYYDNEECTIYSDSWCEKHKNDCLVNFDYNMNYFNNLNWENFDKKLNKLVKSSKKIIEVKNLKEYLNVSGVYILVLDKYKQIYIGLSTNIAKRIQSHWSAKKEFDRLIFGKVENSILSIDSFGALDTTRIFVYPTYDYYLVEEKLVSLMDPMYLLNRTAGGIGSVETYTDDKTSALLAVAANRKKRDFDNIN